MGGGGPTALKRFRLLLPQPWRSPIQSAASAPARGRPWEAVCSAEHVSLDQVDYGGNQGGRADFSRPFQTDQLAPFRQRLPRIHLSPDQRPAISWIASAWESLTRTNATSRAGAIPVARISAAAAITGSFPYQTIHFRARIGRIRPHSQRNWRSTASGSTGFKPDLVVLDPFVGIGHCALAARECGDPPVHRVRHRPGIYGSGATRPALSWPPVRSGQLEVHSAPQQGAAASESTMKREACERLLG